MRPEIYLFRPLWVAKKGDGLGFGCCGGSGWVRRGGLGLERGNVGEIGGAPGDGKGPLGDLTLIGASPLAAWAWPVRFFQRELMD